MASTFTSRNRFTKQGTGDNSNTWGTILNSGAFDLIDDSLDGVSVIDLTGSVTAIDYTTSISEGGEDEARHRILKYIGNPLVACSVTLPALEKWYWVDTSLSVSADMRFIAAGGTAVVTVGPNDTIALYCDGTDVKKMTAGVDSSLYLQVANNLSDLADAATARTNLGLQGGATTSVYVCAGGLAAFTTVGGAAAYPAADGSLITNVSVPYATATSAGIIRIATTAEATVGTDTSTAITPATLNYYMTNGLFETATSSQTGYMKFPGGYVLQWGQTSGGQGWSGPGGGPYDVNITYPLALVTVSPPPIIVLQNVDSVNVDEQRMVSSVTTTTFKIENSYVTKINWFAWGKWE